MDIRQTRGTPFSSTANGISSAMGSAQAVTDVVYHITDIAGSSNSGTALIQVTAANTGGTAVVVWQAQVGTAVAYHQSFTSPLFGKPSGSVAIVVTGTGLCFANMSGYRIP